MSNFEIGLLVFGALLLWKLDGIHGELSRIRIKLHDFNHVFRNRFGPGEPD